MPKIALIEPFRHYEVLDAILRMLESSQESVMVLSNRFCWEQSSFQQANWVVWHLLEKDEKYFYPKYQKELQSMARIIFTTIDIHAPFWSEPKGSPKIYGLVHNAHTFLQPWSHLVWSPAAFAKMMLYTLRRDFYQTKKVLQKLDTILVPAASIEQYLKTHLTPPISKKIKTLNIAFPDQPAIRHQEKTVQITIPGTITQARRDYACLLRVLPLVDQQINRPVRLYLLGHIHGAVEKKIVQQLLTLPFQHLELITFDRYVPPQEFDQCLQQTDFLLLPIQQKIVYKSFYEERGKSCVSGNINDLTKYALPAILPAFYPLPPDLEGLVARYDSDQALAEVLVQWITSKSYHGIKEDSQHLLNQYQKVVLKEFQFLF